MIDSVVIFRSRTPTGYVNIKTYGAKGDGITNDAPAIQKAENAGKSIYFPKGIYRIASNITKRNNVNWLGEGYDSILLFNGDPAAYSYTDIVRNESYGFEDTKFNQEVKAAPWNYAYKSSGKFDSFEFRNLTLRFRSSLKLNEPADGGYIHVFNFMHTNTVKISNVFMDSDSNSNRGNCIFFFKGGNQNTTIEYCKMIHDTNPNVLYGGSIVFASRSTSNPMHNIVINNNNIVKKNGGDEVLWFAANYNSINNITVQNNTITANSSGKTKAPVIMLAQESNSLLPNVKEPFNTVIINNNKISANNMFYSTVFVGYDFGSNPRKAATVTINNNNILTRKSTNTNQVVSGILVGRAKVVNIRNNTIMGNQDVGITANVDIGTKNIIGNKVTYIK